MVGAGDTAAVGRLRVAIVGAGIAGNVIAYRLNGQHDITVFEANAWPGGHSNTVDVEEDGHKLAIDTGFIVFNDRTYPNFIALLDEIGQTWRYSEMSFSVRSPSRQLEYCGSTLDGLFADRRNLFRPSFHRMLRDILRFNREALDALRFEAGDEKIGDYLKRRAYSLEFRDHYLVPMAAAIWSAEPVAIDDMPLRFLLRFFANHGLLELKGRPLWKTIEGGSREYVRRLVSGFRERIRLACPVRRVRRCDDRVDIVTDEHGVESFDAVFLACHSDQALALLEQPSAAEREVLSAIDYRHNEAVLHTDEAVMPKRARARASWNYHLPARARGHVAVTYDMNRLQGLKARRRYFVTLNDDAGIDPARVIRRLRYEHPVFTRSAVAAQGRQAELNAQRTFFCGAYWRHGFHEDGVVSALDALTHFRQRLVDGQRYLRRAG